MKVWTKVVHRWDDALEQYVVDEAESTYEILPDDTPVAECKKDSDPAPAPDPRIGQAAMDNIAIGREALQFYKQAYEEGKPMAQEAQALANKTAIQQMGIAAANEARAGEQWDHYKETFQPVEKQVAADAMGYDSPAAMEARAAEAGLDVSRQAEIANAANQRGMQRMGVNPNSGRYQATQAAMGLNQAVASAGAQTAARTQVRDKGIALRAGAANFGRNMTNTAAQAYGTAVGAGSSGVASMAAGQGIMNANTGVAGQGFTTAMAGNNAAMNGLNSQYQAQLSGWNAQQNANAQSSAGVGALVGTLGSAAIMASDRRLKEDIELVGKDEDTGLNLYKFAYVWDTAKHYIGVMADEVKELFPDAVTTSDEGFDLVNYDMLGLSMKEA